MLIDLTRVRVSGPLSELAAGFAEHLIQRGYEPESARRHIYLLNHLSNWLASEGLDVDNLNAKDVERFQRARYAAGYKSLPSTRAMRPILGYLRHLGIAPTGLPAPATGVFEEFVERFRRYLTVNVASAMRRLSDILI